MSNNKTDKKAPLLKGDVKNDQNIKNQDYPGEPNSKKDEVPAPSKNSKDLPESNDPAGYDNPGNEKETPSGQRDKK